MPVFHESKGKIMNVIEMYIRVFIAKVQAFAIEMGKNYQEL